MTAILRTIEDEPCLIAWERSGGKGETKALRRIGNIFREAVYDFVGSGNKRFAHQTNTVIIENPCSLEPVWRDGQDRVHADLLFIESQVIVGWG